MEQTAREVWLGRVKRWQASGLKAEEFAASEGCHPKTLTVWRWRLGLSRGRTRAMVKGTATKASAPKFVEVLAPQVITAASVPAASAPFDVTLPNGARVMVPARFDASTLAALVEVVGGR